MAVTIGNTLKLLIERCYVKIGLTFKGKKKHQKRKLSL